MNNEFDAIVVGLGLNGGWAVKELTEAGLKVLAIDSGKFLKKSYFKYSVNKEDSESVKDKIKFIKNKLINNKKDFINRLVIERSKKIWQSSNDDPYLSAYDIFEWYRSTSIGGRGHVWGRVSPRLTDREFKADWTNNSDFKWPVSLKDLKNFYSEVEKLLILGGDDEDKVRNRMFVNKRSLNLMEKELVKKIKNFIPKSAIKINSVLEYEPGPISPMLDRAIKTKKLTILSNSIVKNLIIDANNFANGVNVYDKIKSKEKIFKSKIIILAASPFQTIRILRSSTNENFPVGIGNSSNLLGKYIFDHVHTGRSIQFNNNYKFKDNLIKEYFNPFKPNTNSHGFYINPFKTRSYYKNEYNGQFSFQGYINPLQKIFHFDSFGEMIPKVENRINFDFSNKNKIDMPIPKIYFKYSDSEKEMWKHQNLIMNKVIDKFFTLPMVKKKNLYKKNFLKNYSVPIAGSSSHEMGGARMGNSAHKSVVNKDRRLWDSPNVVVCDASIFPSFGYQNIAITSMALTIKNTRNIVKVKRNSKLTFI